jgi:hypothetical protein
VEFVRKALFIRGFEQARTQVFMHFDRGTDDFVRDVVVSHCGYIKWKGI